MPAVLVACIMRINWEQGKNLSLLTNLPSRVALCSYILLGFLQGTIN